MVIPSETEEKLLDCGFLTHTQLPKITLNKKSLRTCDDAKTIVYPNASRDTISKDVDKQKLKANREDCLKTKN